MKTQTIAVAAISAVIFGVAGFMLRTSEKTKPASPAPAIVAQVAKPAPTDTVIDKKREMRNAWWKYIKLTDFESKGYATSGGFTDQAARIVNNTGYPIDHIQVKVVYTLADGVTTQHQMVDLRNVRTGRNVFTIPDWNRGQKVKAAIDYVYCSQLNFLFDENENAVGPDPFFFEFKEGDVYHNRRLR